MQLTCNHCGITKNTSQILVLNVVKFDDSRILDSRNICIWCWDNSNYGSVTDLHIGKAVLEAME